MKRIITILVIFSLILAGCSNRTGTNSNYNGDGKSVDAKAGESLEPNYDNMDVAIVDTPGEPIELSSRSLGNATFNVDKTRAASTEFLADGKEKSISIEDSSGIEWTLTIPKDALLSEEEITITPLTDIEISTLPGARLNGLMMEPDGLEFLSNSTLTISKPGENIKWLVFMAGHDGSEFVFSPAEASADGIKTTVGHFSTLFILPKDDPSANKLLEEAKEEYNEAVDAANELLKKPLEILAPPSISWECISDKELAIAKEYAQRATEEEMEIGKRLVAADRTICLISGKASDFSMAAKLLKRSMAKVDKLIKTYSPQPEKLLAVFHAANRVWKNSFSIEDAPPMSTFLDWFQNTRKYYMDRLIKEHEYKSFGAAIELDRMCTLMGGSRKFDDIFKALTFKLTVETRLSVPGYPITVKGEGILKQNMQSLHDKTLFIQGVGRLGYIYNGEDEDLKIKPEAFPVKMQIRNWDPCKTQKMDILIESLGSDDEEYVYQNAGENQSYPDPIVNDFAEGFFEEEMTEVLYTHEDGSLEAVEMISFNVDLRNGQATAAVKTIDRKQPETEASILVHIQLEHTP